MAAAENGEGATRRTIPRLIKDLLLLPTRIAISAPARKAYLTTFLLFLASSFLALTSVLTYALFYWTYIPSPSFTIPIHFDFSTTSHPIAAYPLASPWTPLLTSNQPYDVVLTLELPRTRANVAAGNFMLDLRLLSPSVSSSSSASTADLMGITPYTANLTHVLRSHHPRILAHSRRSATLTYRTPLLELAKKAMWAPLYLIGWQTESEILTVPMMNDVSFKRGWKNVPRAVLVELQTQPQPRSITASTTAARSARPRLQVYWANVTFTARLQGLRWLMYRHRILSFVVCTSVFWAVEMGVAVSVWGVASLMYYRGKKTQQQQQRDEYAVVKAEAEEDEHGKVRVKQEDDEDEDTMSDTSRSFPTYSRQPPLRYSGTAARIKQEEEEAEEAAAREEAGMGMPVVPTTAAEGDVEDEYEDEDADFVLEQRFERLAGDSGGIMRRGEFDSGIGSSMESSGGRGDLRRRTSRGAR